MEAKMAKLRRELERAQMKSMRAMEARFRLPAGSSRARVTSANAKWAAAAEHRDRIAAQLLDLDYAMSREVER